MNVFISWSGEQSGEIAKIIKDWLPDVIQRVIPFYSEEDIRKGARWSEKISEKLEKSCMGIICLTEDNLEKPWIMFEAGALSKNLGNSKVIPLLFGVNATTIEGPLAQFQAAYFSEEEMKKLVNTINEELKENKVDSKRLEKIFKREWINLKNQVDNILSTKKSTKKSITRSDRELLEELLLLTRELSSSSNMSKISNIRRRLENIHPRVVQDLLIGMEKIAKYGGQMKEEEFNRFFDQMLKPIEYLIEQCDSLEQEDLRGYLKSIKKGLISRKARMFIEDDSDIMK